MTKPVKSQLAWIFLLVASFQGLEAQEGSWRDVRALGAAVNGLNDPASQDISSDGRMLIFSATPAGESAPDLYMATRASSDEAFGDVSRLEYLSSPGFEISPNLSSDDTELYFMRHSGATFPPSDGDILVSRWLPEEGTFGDPEPVEGEVNTVVREGWPVISPDGLELYVERFGDIYVARRESTEDPFGEASLVEELANAALGGLPASLSSDGKTLFFNRPDTPSGSWKSWMATREGSGAKFAEPVRLDPAVNSDGANFGPSVSADWPRSGSKLYFTRCTGPCSILEATWHQAPVEGDFVVGGDRPVTVHVPSIYDPEVPIPVVVNLHGLGGSGAIHENAWKVLPLADELGFVYLYPDGAVNNLGDTSWNATDACCGSVPESDVDDSGYLAGLVDEISTRVNVDRDRIYFMGHSNGAFMCHRVACDHADVIAAIAAHGGVTFYDPSACAPSEPVHVLQIHGTLDGTIPYDGGFNDVAGAPFPGVEETVRRWALSNGCSGDPLDLDIRFDLDVDTPGAETRVRRYDGCDPRGSTELWIREGGYHLPRGWTRNGASTNFATQVIDWFLDHPKHPAPKGAFTISVSASPLELSFDGSRSAAPDGARLDRWIWSFGDGTSASGQLVSHLYAEPGTYRVTLRVVTDDERVSRIIGEDVTIDMGPRFRRGNSNDDGSIDLSDAVFTLNWLFTGGTAPHCLAAANVNGDANVDLSDAVSLLNYLFLGGPAPAAPFAECGPGTLDADEALGCAETACP